MSKPEQADVEQAEVDSPARWKERLDASLGRNRSIVMHPRRGGVLREAYDVTGDGVARADLDKLSRRDEFKESVRAALEKNGALREAVNETTADH